MCRISRVFLAGMSVVSGFIIFNTVASAENISVHIRPGSRNSVFIEGSRNAQSKVSKATAEQVKEEALQSVLRHKSSFAVNEKREMKIVKRTEDELGLHHVLFVRLMEGIPVFGADIMVHLNQDLSLRSISGKKEPAITIDSVPRISADDAEADAVNAFLSPYREDIPVVLSNDLVVFDPALIGTESRSIPPALAYVVKLRSASGTPRRTESIFIDAGTGAVLYILSHTREELYRRIFDCSSGHCQPARAEGMTAYGPDSLYNTTDVDDLYALLGNVHRYYADRFSIDGANGAGGIGDGKDAPKSETQAFTFIDDVVNDCPNAFFDGFSLNFCFGMVHDDVVGHEYQHAVTNYAIVDWRGDPAGLNLAGEPGALGESISDIFGESIEEAVKGKSDWLAGSDVNAPDLKGPLRSLSNPSEYREPDRHYSSLFYCGTDDHGGVHVNSTVLSHAFYLLINGGTFNGCTVEALNRTKVENVLYRAVKNYFTSSTDFNESYDFLNEACADLYTTDFCGKFKAGLQAVELDQPGRCSGMTRSAPKCSQECSGCVDTGLTPAPTPLATATPVSNLQDTSPTLASSLSLRGMKYRRFRRNTLFLFNGYVRNRSGTALGGKTVSLTCVVSGKRRTQAAQSRSASSLKVGFYQFRISIGAGRRATCRATSGGISSYLVRVRG